MNVFVRLLLLTVAFISGCATVSAPESWKEPIVPKTSLSYEVERPWEALAVRHAEGKLFSVAIPEEWYRTQFPYVPVKEPESKEVIPLQRMVSRAALFCDGIWIRSSAVINRNGYDVLVQQRCKEGDSGVIISGSGKYVLTFSGEIVRDVQVESLLGDMKYREQFFSAHPSIVRHLRTDMFPSDVLKQLNQVIVSDGDRFRIGFETLLAVMITVGSSIEERFLDCGGGDVNVVSAAVVPLSVFVKGGIAFFCAAIGQPTGLFIPDSDQLSALRGERNSIP